MNLPEYIYEELKDINAVKCYHILADLGHEGIFVYLQGQIVFVKDWIQQDSINWLLARQTPIITFWGGPPNRLTYYKGNLQTLLLDRMYDYLCQHTTTELEQILRFST